MVHVATAVRVGTTAPYISVVIDGKWGAIDFIKLLTAFDNLFALEIPANQAQRYYRSEIIKAVSGTNKKLTQSKELKTLVGKIVDDTYPQSFQLRGQEIPPDFLTDQFSTAFAIEEFSDPYVNGYAKIKRIEYASPGRIDLEGSSSIMKVVFEIIKYCFPNQRERRRARLEDQFLAEQVLEKRINNWKAAGYSQSQIKKLAGGYMASISAIGTTITPQSSAKPSEAVITDINYIDQNGEVHSINDDNQQVF